MKPSEFLAMRERIKCPAGMRILPINMADIYSLMAPDGSLDIMPDDFPPNIEVDRIAVVHRTVNTLSGEPLDVCIHVSNATTPEKALPYIFMAFFKLAHHAIWEEAQLDGATIVDPHPDRWTTVGWIGDVQMHLILDERINA